MTQWTVSSGQTDRQRPQGGQMDVTAEVNVHLLNTDEALHDPASMGNIWKKKQAIKK